MRVFLYTLIGLPLLFADAVLLYTLPVRIAGRLTPVQGLILLSGGFAYALFHFLLRKPERMYLWAHEFTHLIVAKLCLRQVRGFHITSRTGGKVVVDRTNVAIDLAPYAVPLYNLSALVPLILLRGRYPHAREIYLGAAAFLFTMHLWFSVEGFFDGQPDVLRNGRVFSGAVVFMMLLFWVPCLAAPGTRTGFSSLPSFYRDWLGGGVALAMKLLSRGRGLL